MRDTDSFSFLPNTVSFEELPPKESRGKAIAQAHKRARSDLQVSLTKRNSTTSLLDPPTAAIPAGGVSADDDLKRLFAKPGDPRSLLRSDTHAEW